MGRRALPKVDPTLDLSNHLYRFEDLPQPWDGRKVFGRSAPLEVEVGSGKGLFLLNAAQANPDVDYFGCEIAGKYARYSAARLLRNGVENAAVLIGDGLRVFRELLPDESLAGVHVYFPDPWWKARHKKRRVMTESFLKDVQRTLQPGGRLHFWTDVEEYFHSTLELLAEVTSLAGPLKVPVQPAEHDLDYRTNFERRMRLHDVPVYRSEYLKEA